MNKPQRPILHFTIGDYLKAWRDAAGLSQSELAALSDALEAENVIDRRYTQGLISRMEKSRHPDMRDDNLRAICTLLSVALNNAGHTDTTPDDLIKALRATKRKRAAPGELDDSVLHFNALLQAYPPTIRRIFWRAAEALLIAIDEQYKVERDSIRSRIAQKRKTGGDSEN